MMRISNTAYQGIGVLSDLRSDDLAKILAIIGADPTHFFDNGRWINLDFSKYDMLGVQFKGATVVGCRFAAGTVKEETIAQCRVFVGNQFIKRKVSGLKSLNRTSEDTTGVVDSSRNYDLASDAEPANPRLWSAVEGRPNLHAKRPPPLRLIKGRVRVIAKGASSEGLEGALCRSQEGVNFPAQVGRFGQVKGRNGIGRHYGLISHVGPMDKSEGDVLQSNDFVVKLGTYDEFDVGDELFVYESDDEFAERQRMENSWKTDSPDVQLEDVEPTDGASSSRTASLASIARMKMTYDEMIDKGWNPPIHLAKSLMRSASSYPDALHYIDDLMRREVSLDNATLEVVFRKATSFQERLNFLKIFNRGSHHAEFFAQLLFSELDWTANGRSLWELIQDRPELSSACLHLLISSAPTGVVARTLVQRAISLKLRIERDALHALLRFEDDDTSTLNLLKSASKAGVEFAEEVLISLKSKDSSQQ